MGKIVIKGYRTPLVLGDENGKALADESGALIEVVLVPDAGNLSLVKRGKSTIVTARQNKVILSDDTVTLSVRSNSPLDIRVNDWFEVYGEVYRINTPPKVQKNNTFSFEYEITGQGIMYDMLRCKFFNADSSGFKTTMDFPLIGTIETFLLVLKANMQRLSVDWEIGNFTNGETKTITFSNDTCLSALQKICQEFDTEFWVKYEGGKYVIHTGAFGSTLPVALEYGKGKGLYNLTRKNVNEEGIITRLYIAGGTQNIPSSYRNYSDRLKFSDDGFIEDTTLTSSIGLREGAIIFDDIYPHRTGSVTTANSVVKFTDTAMDFDLNEKETDGVTTKYLIAGTTAKIHFNTGNLAGYEFEVKSYNHATKEFEIIPFDNQNGQVFPDANSAAFQFGVGDEYVLLDIVMPQSYIDNAEAELLIKGTEQFDLLKQSKVSYDLDVAEDFLKTLSSPLNIGDLVRVVDTQLGIDKVLRINQITRNFIENGTPNDYDYKIVIADAYEVAFASKLILDIQKVKNIINVNKIDQLRLSRIGLKVTEELKVNIFDPDGYFDPENIKPESIEAGMLAVGSRSQAISTNLIFRTNVGGNANSVSGDAFRLYSQTLNKEWNLSSFAQVVPDNNLRYVYAKVSKTNATGAIHITTAKIPYDSDPNDYYILLGMLSSVIEGSRVFVPTYGLTTITGGLIRTGIISDEGGTFQINLNTGVITADKITFKAPDNSYKDLTDTIGGIDANLVNLNATRDYVNTVLQTDLEDLKNRADGVIESWFYNHSPTLSNLPASNWTTNEQKDSHIGDTFTNMQEFVDNTTTPDAGKAWRFAKVGSVYSWNLIANSDSTKALIEAGKAKDTADSKRRNFIVQPFTPYEVGDMWMQGAGGEIMKCDVARISGAFVPTDWSKASKYTDDTRAEEIRTELQTSVDNSLTAAKAYSDAELNARETTIKAYADGKVDAEEARAIADAQAKADAAKAYADAQDLLLTTQLEAYADGAVSTEESSRIAQAQANLQAAKDYADAQADAARITAEAYADGKVDDEEARAIADANTKLNTAKAYAEAQDSLLRTELQVYADGKVSDEEAARLAQAATNLQAAKDYAAAEDALKETSIKAYADGKIDAAEQRSITDATNKADAAKTYAVAQDNLLKTQLEAYTDGKIDAEEQARIDAALQAIEAAQDYTDKQAILSKIAFEAYADGKVDAEEAARIAEAERAMNEAKEYAESLLDGKKIGAKQLLREYDTRFNYAYWGGSGSGNEYDLDTIDPVESIVLGFGVNTAIVDENNKFFEIIF